MKKAFLAPLAVLAASLNAGQAQATALPTPSSEVAPQSGGSVDNVISVKHEGDIFNFVLRRNAETGQVTADHESHYSHSSHRSHVSGY